MSFIAITYGYNQFSIFNTNVSTLPLIDNIIATCLEETISSLDARFKSLTKELEDYSLEEDTLRKSIKKLESDRQREEEKMTADQQKANEPSAKDGKKLGVKATPKPAANSKSVITNEGVNPIHVILEEIKSLDNKLQQLVANRDKMVSKKKMLFEFKEKYDAFNLEKKKLKIDLVDVNGDRLNIHTKGDSYANSYLIDRQCYELNRSYNNEKSENVIDPLKIDGFCLRSLEDDIKWEEYEKTNKHQKKPPKKK